MMGTQRRRRSDTPAISDGQEAHARMLPKGPRKNNLRDVVADRNPSTGPSQAPQAASVKSRRGERCGKGPTRTGQVRDEKTNMWEPLLTHPTGGQIAPLRGGKWRPARVAARCERRSRVLPNGLRVDPE